MNGEQPPQGLQAWMQLCELVDVTRIALNRALLRDADLSLAENLVLCQVAMAPEGRLRMVDIADLLTIGKSAVTKTVDRLEHRGLLVRRRPASNRRTVYATLTAGGAQAFERAQPAFLDALGRYFSQALNEKELGQLLRASGKVLNVCQAPVNPRTTESQDAMRHHRKPEMYSSHRWGLGKKH